MNKRKKKKKIRNKNVDYSPILKAILLSIENIQLKQEANGIKQKIEELTKEKEPLKEKRDQLIRVRQRYGWKDFTNSSWFARTFIRPLNRFWFIIRTLFGSSKDQPTELYYIAAVSGTLVFVFYGLMFLFCGIGILGIYKAWAQNVVLTTFNDPTILAKIVTSVFWLTFIPVGMVFRHVAAHINKITDTKELTSILASVAAILTLIATIIIYITTKGS